MKYKGIMYPKYLPVPENCNRHSVLDKTQGNKIRKVPCAYFAWRKSSSTFLVTKLKLSRIERTMDNYKELKFISRNLIGLQ